MKKLFLYATMCLMALSMNAQRCAVLEFKAGVGISQADVDGISGIFITYFRPAGYTMVERTQIDRVIDEQGFQRSKMTESQMVRVGQILNVSKIVVGDINVVMGQYNVDARVINVESGTIAATEGATFDGSSYRTSMQKIAQNLASQIAISSGGIVYTNSGQQSLPKSAYIDLGLPSGTLWKRTNEIGFLKYNDAIEMYGNKLPTKEQFEELKRECDWEWTGKAMKFTGPNGNTIELNATGFESATEIGAYQGIGVSGLYWSSSINSNEGYYLVFSAKYFKVIGEYIEGNIIFKRGGSIRLVKKKYNK